MTTIFEDLMTGLGEADDFLAGKNTGYKVSVPTEVDVKAIRKRLNMTQSRFSDTFGFSLDAVKHWEGGRRTPESSARAFLTVIAKNPDAVIAALHPLRTTATTITHSNNSVRIAKTTHHSVASTKAPHKTHT